MMRVALLVMLAATTAQHLGLTEAVASVLGKIASCPMCSTFWCALAVLILCGADVFTAAGLSLLAAYVSHWYSLVLMEAGRIYDMIWRRIRKGRGR